MSIFDMLLQKGIMGEGGGGGWGSSDFSTAQVTVTMAENEWESGGRVQFASDEETDYRFRGMFLYNDGTFYNDSQTAEPNNPTTTNAIWVGDNVEVVPNQHIASVSGNAVITEDGTIIISGDCTINLDKNWA